MERQRPDSVQQPELGCWKIKPLKLCCSISGHGWLRLGTPSADISRRSVEECWAQVRTEQTCPADAAPWAARCYLSSCRDQSRCLFLRLTLLAKNFVRINYSKLRLSSENSKHHYPELSTELHPSREVSTRLVPPKHGAGTCLRVVLERTGATHWSTGAAVDHALTSWGQLQTPLQSW